MKLLSLVPGHTLHLSIDVNVSVSTNILVDMDEFQKDLEDYARKLILACSKE